MTAAATQRDHHTPEEPDHAPSKAAGAASLLAGTEPVTGWQASDEPLVELLRGKAALGVSDLTAALGVTATAVRQRLQRLMRAGLVVREQRPAREATGRGRPSHVYRLSERGQRIGGDNFRDLAMVLWQEVRRIEEPSVRRGLLSRIGHSLAEACRSRGDGFAAATTPTSRLAAVTAALRARKIACECASGEGEGTLSVLTTHTCPYPQLAEVDRGICAVEREMLEQLVEAPVRLTECRLDGDACCRFTVSASSRRPAPSRQPRREKEA